MSAKAGWRPIWHTTIDLSKETSAYTISGSVLLTMNYPTCSFSLSGKTEDIPQHNTAYTIQATVAGGASYIAEVLCEFPPEVHDIAIKGQLLQDQEQIIVDLDAQPVVP